MQFKALYLELAYAYTHVKHHTYSYPGGVHLRQAEHFVDVVACLLMQVSADSDQRPVTPGSGKYAGKGYPDAMKIANLD